MQLVGRKRWEWENEQGLTRPLVTFEFLRNAKTFGRSSHWWLKQTLFGYVALLLVRVASAFGQIQSLHRWISLCSKECVSHEWRIRVHFLNLFTTRTSVADSASGRLIHRVQSSNLVLKPARLCQTTDLGWSPVRWLVSCLIKGKIHKLD